MASKVQPVASFFFFFFFSFFVLGFISSEAQSVPALYVFGDSLADVGNNNYLIFSLTKANFPHNGVDFPGRIPTGRFSNGKNAADFLAEKLGLPTSPPYLSNPVSDFPQGVSFASGGAGILNGTDELDRRTIPFTRQVTYYSTVYQRLVATRGSGAAQVHLSKSLFAIVIGSNDVLGFYNSSNPQQYVDLMLSILEGQMKRLHGLGARKFVMIGIPAIGCCPTQRIQNKNEECNEKANYWSTKYNTGLKSMLQRLKSELRDINYSYIESYTIFTNFRQQPAAYGFKEVKAACCGLGRLKAQIPCVPISIYCPNRSDHVFWDLYHPTEAADRIFVDLLYTGSQQYANPINVQQLVSV